MEFKNKSLKAQRQETNKPKVTIVNEERHSLFGDIFTSFKERAVNVLVKEIIKPLFDELYTSVGNAILSTISKKIFHTDVEFNRNSSYERSYDTYYKSSRQPVERKAQKNRLDTEAIIFNSRNEADSVLRYLKERIREYGRATLADFYDCVGISTNFQDETWSWSNVDTAYITPKQGGYSIQLPRPKHD